MDGGFYEKEWYEEGNVAKRIKLELEKTGYTILKFNVDKRSKGHDIEARDVNGKILVVETKGFPSKYYVRGINVGEKKHTHPNLQAKHWFSEGLFYLMKVKSRNPDVEVALGLPKNEKNLEFINEIKFVSKLLGILYYLVSEDGSVEKITFNEFNQEGDGNL